MKVAFKQNGWSQIKHIWLILTHLKLCVAVAKYNFEWVQNLFFNVGLAFTGLKQKIVEYCCLSMAGTHSNWLTERIC